MKNTIFLILLITTGFCFGQEPKFDKLEQLYSQGHYKMVHRKANRLIKKQEYNYSLIPSYYIAITQIQLSTDNYWLKKHPDALVDSKNRIIEIKKNTEGKRIIETHINEIAELREDILNWHSVNQSMKNIGIERWTQLEHIFEILFKDISIPEITPIANESNIGDNSLNKNRRKIIKEASKHIGTPYLWGGTTTNGFDCSGFTQYVYKKNSLTIPRVAKHQYANAKKIKEKNLKTGDLVFFSNSSKISHVGIIYSIKDSEIKMIHASSSKGITITDLKKSKYWMTRLKGYGTFIEK
ncbi:MAG: hypothetical protein CL824_01670 [Crocinitomicaceae bacterium]|nr:hypothetical protein [Crocinitomicaceae bacterium]|tara:strand:- start:262 stop:1149 length:888 start_codon:yes stop_codon:yes gene_type:complete